MTQTLRALLIWSSASFVPFGADAQPTALDSAGDRVALEETEKIGFASGSFVVAPIPFQSPALESGLLLGGAYLFQADEASESSTLGGAVFRTSNGSEGYGLGADVALSENRWKLRFLAAEMDLNYDFFVGNSPLPITQSARGGLVGLSYGFSPEFSLGLNLSYADTALAPNLPSLTGALPPDLRPDADLELGRIGLIGEWDRRDDTLYPASGMLASAELIHGTFLNLEDRDYSKAVASASLYRSILRNEVFAARVTACAASEDAPFFDSCALGQADNFRGYEATRFIGDGLFSVQAEYRGRISRRFGYVVFAGAGSVGDDFGDAFGGAYRSAAGVGARLRLSRKFPVDYSIDVSGNEEGEGLLYVSVGQRF
ncbi:MAG: BamA/TamA family outer membrane protein [Pseudomonadota bacterium]